MGTKATGVFKEVRYKTETTWGTPAGTSDGKQLRRVTADFNPTAESYSSSEINTTFQNVDTRLGVRGADGSLNGELSPGSYSDFFAAVLAKDFVSVVGADDATLTIATSGTNFTITRSDVSGDFLEDGIKVGHVVRMTGVNLNTANVDNNCLVLAATSTQLTVKVLSGVSLVAESNKAASNLTPVGKHSYIPKTSHTDKSFTVEQWYSDIEESELFTGMKVGSIGIQLPATGIVTADFSFMGRGLTQGSQTQYFVNPSDISSTGILTAVQGALIVDGVNSACITDASINIERTMEPATCVGSNFNSEIFVGKINVTGSLSLYFSDDIIREKFTDETDSSLILVLTTGQEKTSDFISIVIPKVKFTSFSHADSETGIVSSLDFTALFNPNTTTGLIESTILVQDSQA